MSFNKYLLLSEDHYGILDREDTREAALKSAKEYSFRKDTEVCIYRADDIVKAAMPTGLEIPAIVMSV